MGGVDRIRKGKLPRTMEEIGGTVESFEKGLSIFEIGEQDVIYYSCGGGGGYGDPLEREPELVLKDVISGYVSPEGAKKDYGVIVDPEKLELDLRETEKERRRIIEERLKRGRK
jgi:N-methylhydantoinase B